MGRKPLLLVDTDKNYGPTDSTYRRFTVRWVYNGDNHAAMARNQAWGWAAYERAPILPRGTNCACPTGPYPLWLPSPTAWQWT